MTLLALVKAALQTLSAHAGCDEALRAEVVALVASFGTPDLGDEVALDDPTRCNIRSLARYSSTGDLQDLSGARTTPPAPTLASLMVTVNTVVYIVVALLFRFDSATSERN